MPTSQHKSTKTPVLFIDRDGTLIQEPPVDYQVDSLEKLSYIPTVFRGLGRIARELNYKLVMVSNQDGLGTDSFPEETFHPAHNKMMEALEGEGIHFDEVLIDRSMPEDNAPTRKPKTGLLTSYLSPVSPYDIENSYVIGDRDTDMILAKNIGCRGIYFGSDTASSSVPEVISLHTTDWVEVYRYLRSVQRRAVVHRQTKETDVYIDLRLDGTAQAEIETGLGFFDHMLDQLVRHSGIDLTVQTKGDLHVDEHHSIEDTALALGEAFHQALQNKVGLMRYGFFLPMDDVRAKVGVDFGGRNWLVWKAKFSRERIGDVPTEMFYHFFKSFSDKAMCNLSIQAKGNNEHHKIEAIFKAWAKAIRMAISVDESVEYLPTTKGTL